MRTANRRNRANSANNELCEQAKLCEQCEQRTVRTVRCVRTGRTANRANSSHWTNSANSSHCPNSANSEQCERFILSEQCEQRTVRTVHFLKIVEQGEQCEQVRTLFGGAWWQYKVVHSKMCTKKSVDSLKCYLGCLISLLVLAEGVDMSTIISFLLILSSCLSFVCSYSFTRLLRKTSC